MERTIKHDKEKILVKRGKLSSKVGNKGKHIVIGSVARWLAYIFLGLTYINLGYMVNLQMHPFAGSLPQHTQKRLL